MSLKSIFITLLMTFLITGCQQRIINQAINNQSSTSNEVDVVDVKEVVTGDKTESSSSSPDIDLENMPEPEVNESVIPESLDYPVAFISQAPYAVWDDLHKEACEEASMIMVAKYFKQEPLTAHTMEQSILNLVNWENDSNYKIDLTALEVRDILENYFDLKAELVTEVTIERIKEELASGKLIIVPAAGRQLGNPYFQTPGPIYHMLVIRGYDERNFITNDVGTKRGEGYKYKYQKLIDAIHDWDHNLAIDGMTDEEINQGRKAMIVVSK